VDGLFVYWSSMMPEWGTTGAIWRTLADGSQSQPTMIVSGVRVPDAISLDPEYVYWTDHENVTRVRR
jgi:hypothetical protein